MVIAKITDELADSSGLKDNFESGYALSGESLQEVLAGLLKQKNLKLAVAESLTGGLVAAKLVEVSGISENLIEGIVAYANSAKQYRLNVSAETLQKYGAVSSEIAEEMAKGLIREGIDIAVSTTGIAGPDGGNADKPIGLVYFGVAYKNRVESKKMIFKGNREDIRQQATNYALYFLIETINKG